MQLSGPRNVYVFWVRSLIQIVKHRQAFGTKLVLKPM